MKEVIVNFERINTNTQNKQTKKAPIPRKAELFLLGAIHLLLSLYLPAALFLDVNELVLQAVSVAASVFAAFAFARLSRRGKGVISYVLILVACFMFLGTIICGLAASFVGSAYILSYMLVSFKSKRDKLLAFVPAILSYIISAVLLANPAYAAVSLAYIPASALLSYAFSKKLGRISSICHTSVGIVLTLVLAAAAVYSASYGTDLSMISSAFDSAKASLHELISETFYAIYNEIGYELSSFDSAELASVIVNTAFNLLPAIIIVISNVIAFILQSMLASCFINNDTPKEEIRNMVAFDMSIVSAIVFLVAFLVAAIFSNEISVLSVTAENIAIILMPGLIFTAVIALQGIIFGKNASCFGIIVYFAAILMFFYIPSIMFTVSALAGSVIVILNNVAKSKANKKQ